MSVQYTHRLHYTESKGSGEPTEESFEISVHHDRDPEVEGRDTISHMNEVSDGNPYKFVRIEPL